MLNTDQTSPAGHQLQKSAGERCAYHMIALFGGWED